MRRTWDQLPDQRRRQLDCLEAWARSKQVGLWGTPPDAPMSPTPPWAWRRAQRADPPLR